MKPFTTITTAFFLLLAALPSCKAPEPAAREMITIDVIPALNKYREFRLSEMVESIEYIKLETRPECLVSEATMVVGEKCIVLLNHRPSQVYLFDRNGKFLRPVGKVGKGPGEYSWPDWIDLNPDENRILVNDLETRKVLEYSLEGTLLTSLKLTNFSHKGPVYLNSETVVFVQAPLHDTTHYPRLVALNLKTGIQKPLIWFDYTYNSTPGAGYCYGNDFFRTDDGVLFKDALCDTVYKISPEVTVKPFEVLKAFPIRAQYYCMTEEELDLYSDVSVDLCYPPFTFLIGNNRDRFHMVHNSLTGEAYALPKLTKCKFSDTYEYGIINDMDGSKPLWFFGNGTIREQAITNLMQMVDLKELIQTDCFNQAALKTEKYRDQLRKLVEESSEMDNPIIRIMHLK
jgi:hypothetical protein